MCLSKISIARACTICILLGWIQACRPNPNTTVLFENRSTKQIDSVEISIGQYRMVFYQVAPNTSVNRLLRKDSVQTLSDSLQLHATLSAAGDAPVAGAYRDHSHRDMAVMYTITYTDNHQLQIQPGHKNPLLH